MQVKEAVEAQHLVWGDPKKRRKESRVKYCLWVSVEEGEVGHRSVSVEKLDSVSIEQYWGEVEVREEV